MSAHVQRAWQLFQVNRFDLAEQELLEALRQEPDHASAHAMQGYVLARRGEYQRAHEEIDQAVGLAPDSAYPYFVRSWTLGMQEKYLDGRAAILEALRIEPNDPEFLDQYSWLCYNLDEYVVALKAAEAGLRQHPEHTGCMSDRAMALLGLNDHDAAVQVMTRALEFDPLSSRLHTNLGWIYSRMEKRSLALQHFSEGLRLEPESASCRAGFTTGVSTFIAHVRGYLVAGSFAGVFFLFVAVRIAGLPAVANQLLWGGMIILAGLTGMLFSSIFVLQLRAEGRALLSENKFRQCFWLNAWLAACVLTGFLLVACGLYAGASVCLTFIGALSGALFTECKPGWDRRIFLSLVAITIVTSVHGRHHYPDGLRLGSRDQWLVHFPETILMVYLVAVYVLMVLNYEGDPHAAVRGLVIREGLRRRASRPIPD